MIQFSQKEVVLGGGALRISKWQQRDEVAMESYEFGRYARKIGKNKMVQ